MKITCLRGLEQIRTWFLEDEAIFVPNV